ncbi:hypothetical protein Hdeb2414_s0008g00274031 [Helianthus debilis subsp. tardiflorus]
MILESDGSGFVVRSRLHRIHTHKDLQLVCLFCFEILHFMIRSGQWEYMSWLRVGSAHSRHQPVHKYIFKNKW